MSIIAKWVEFMQYIVLPSAEKAMVAAIIGMLKLASITPVTAVQVRNTIQYASRTIELV